MSEQPITTPDAAQAPEDYAAFEAWSEGKTPNAEPENAGGEPLKAAQSEAEGEPESESTETEEEKKHKKGGWQRKIEKAEREIETLKAQLAAQPAGTEPRQESPQYAQPKPKLDQFESLEEFTEALSDWKADEREWKHAQADRHAKAQSEAVEAITLWNQRKAEAQKAHSDYDDALSDADDVKLSAAHQRLFLDSEQGPELAYALARDRKELEKFAKLDPLQAAKYLGKLEASLSSSTPQTSKPATRAPKPPTTVGGRGSASHDPFDERLAGDYESWERARIAQLRSRGR